MSNAAFQLLLNMRIVAVALLTVSGADAHVACGVWRRPQLTMMMVLSLPRAPCSGAASQVTVLGKPLNKVKWFGIALLTNGAVQYQLSGSADGGSLKTGPEGLIVMMVIIACAAGGNVVTQLVMQKSMDQPLMLQNAILYSWGVVMNGANWWWSVEGHGGSAAVPWFGDFGGAALFLCVFSAIYGLSISVILKRFGSLTRTFISTVAIVLNAIIDCLFFGETLSVLECSTFLTIFAAIFLFTILGDEWEAAAGTKPGAGHPSAKPTNPLHAPALVAASASGSSLGGGDGDGDGGDAESANLLVGKTRSS